MLKCPVMDAMANHDANSAVCDNLGLVGPQCKEMEAYETWKPVSRKSPSLLLQARSEQEIWDVEQC